MVKSILKYIILYYMISLSLLLFIIGVVMIMVGQIKSESTPSCEDKTKIVISDERKDKKDDNEELFNRSLFYSEITL
tara:strand:- start:2274 stop:2504 length:231 start_codon:yes stop_codon:yes gene_type:complete